MSSRVSNYVKFRNVFGHSTSSYHPDALKIDTMQVDVFKVDKIWGPWKEKSLISQENYVSVPKSLFLSGLDQNISLYQRFLLMMKDFWGIIIWKIKFGLLKIDRWDWMASKARLGFVYQFEPTYYTCNTMFI